MRKFVKKVYSSFGALTRAIAGLDTEHDCRCNEIYDNGKVSSCVSCPEGTGHCTAL